MSALNARRWRVRGQMVATGDSARRCARVDGFYSAPGVDGVYSTPVREVRVEGVRSARLLDRCGAQASSWVGSRALVGGASASGLAAAQPCVRNF